MKITALLIPFALLPVLAQIQRPPAQAPEQAPARTPAAPLPAGKAAVPLDAMADLEKKLNAGISAASGSDPCIIVSGSRGVYVTGFGTLFTSDVDLINSPGGLFDTITPDRKAQVRKRKLANAVLLQKAMGDMVRTVSSEPSLKGMADTDQIVMVVRLVYRPWEDTSGLPGQIVVRADRRGGNIRTELQ